jgi:aspartate racemase
MIKLGLIGGIGPESSISYYKAITAGYYQQTGNFPRLSIESLSVFNILRFVDRGDKAALANYILKGIRDLENGGAQVAVLTGITPHVVIKRIRERSSLPIVSLLDTMRMAIQELGMVRNSTKVQMKEIVERIIEKYHSDLVILGCMELPLIFNQISLPVRTLDVTENHIQKLISMIVNS